MGKKKGRTLGAYRSNFDGNVMNSPAERRKADITLTYQRILTEMCANRFKWSGLPDSVDERFLELCLFRRALCVFYYDPSFDALLACEGQGQGQPNMYDNPTQFIVYGNRMVSKTLDADECVPVWANSLRVPDHDVVRLYSQRLAEIDVTLDINILTQRHPFIVSVPTQERVSLMNAFRQVQEGQPVIWGTQSLSQALEGGVSLFNVGVDSKAINDLMTTKAKVWNECLTLLGIVNVNDEKKERMVSTEAEASVGHVMAMRNIALHARQLGCEQINEAYGTNISVDWDMDSVDTTAPDSRDVISEKGEDDG